MKIHNFNGSKVGIVSVDELLQKSYSSDPVNLNEYRWIGQRKLSKSSIKNKILSAPFSMLKLLNLADKNEYHSGCIDAIVNASLIQVKCENSEANNWLKNSHFGSSFLELASEYLHNYIACGNAFWLKMRNSKGDWAGLEPLHPKEVSIVEKYDSFGVFKPEYIQAKQGKKKLFANSDIIHLKRYTPQSRAWGLASLPIVVNIEILNEIKTFNYNNFKRGLLIDYMVIIEGGSLSDRTITNAEGEEVQEDAFTYIQSQFAEAVGNTKSHGMVILEGGGDNVKIKLEPLRQNDKDGGFLKLKKDLREGIFAYHRVPARIVSQLVSGQLGGDNKSDMLMFYNFVIKPLQAKLSELLASELRAELKINVEASDFNFGNLTDAFESDDVKIFNNNKT